MLNNLRGKATKGIIRRGHNYNQAEAANTNKFCNPSCFETHLPKGQYCDNDVENSNNNSNSNELICFNSIL